jgi:hypothetical protein
MSEAVAIGVRSVSHLKACYEWVSQSAGAQRAEPLPLPFFIKRIQKYHRDL